MSAPSDLIEDYLAVRDRLSRADRGTGELQGQLSALMPPATSSNSQRCRGATRLRKKTLKPETSVSLLSARLKTATEIRAIFGGHSYSQEKKTPKSISKFERHHLQKHQLVSALRMAL